MNKAAKIMDSVSASQLLKALTTLQNLSIPENDGQISFSQDSKIRSQFNAGNSKVMNYEQYMAKKSENPVKKDERRMKNQQRASFSPLSELHSNHTVRIADLKSRSHSPINARPTDRTLLQTQKKQVKPNPQKENKRQDHNSKPISDKQMRASFHSKKILSERQKKGDAYVPIQLRTENLLRQKQVKLAKLQKEQQISNMLKEKQCTFKPNIIKNYRKPKATAIPSHQPLNPIIQQQRFQSTKQNLFQSIPVQTPPQKPQPHCQSTEYLISNQRRQQPQPRKYKNQKFNFLLDLIH